MYNFTVAVGSRLEVPFQPSTFIPCAYVRSYLGDYETRYVTCEEPVKGRFVVVYREERGQIQMCEFEVYGNQTQGQPNFTKVDQTVIIANCNRPVVESVKHQIHNGAIDLSFTMRLLKTR